MVQEVERMKNWYEALEEALEETIRQADKPAFWIQGFREGWLASINHLNLVFRDELDRHDRRLETKPVLWRRILGRGAKE